MSVNTPWISAKGESGSYVEDCFGNIRSEYLDEDEAHLIAAAPELLEALKESRDAIAVIMQGIFISGFAEEIMNITDKMTGGRYDGFGERADTAIAKAEGRA